MAQNEGFGALGDLRVIDLTQMLAGPFGTMMLADHGAEVIKIEPFEGEMTRRGTQFHRDDTERSLNGYFQSVDRNKKSVCLDLKTEEGRAALLKLVENADALVENFRPGVMDRLGIGYEALRKVNPRLVYGALSGFGDPRGGASPYCAWPAFDVVAQAMGGIMAITGPDEHTPTKVGPGIGDVVPGIMLAFGVLSAIHEARRSGQGQFVDVSMIDTILSISERIVWQHSLTGAVDGPHGNHHPFLSPFGMFAVKNGFVTIAAQQDSFFEILCQQIDAPGLATDERYASQDMRTRNRLALVGDLESRLKQFTKAELVERLGGRIPFGPVLDIAEIATDPHFAAREMIVDIEQPGLDHPIQVAGLPVKLTRTPGRIDHRAPLLGEHTEHYLRLAGLNDDQIAACRPKRRDGHAISGDAVA